MKKDLIKNKNQYIINGYSKINNFFSKEDVLSLKKNVLKNINKKKYNFYYEKIKGKEKIRRIEKVSDYIKFSKKIIFSKKIKNLIKFFENKDYVLFKDKINFKYPGGKGFLPHIDGHFLWKDRNNIIQKGWKKYSNEFLSVVVPLEKTIIENGCIYLSKKKDTFTLGKTFDKITNKLEMNTPNIKKKYLKNFKFYPIEMKVGDILVFNWLCAHFSKKNNSQKSRMIMYLTFCPKERGNTVIRNKYYFDKENSLNKFQNKSLQ